jgi:hypothetical protein
MVSLVRVVRSSVARVTHYSPILVISMSTFGYIGTIARLSFEQRQLRMVQ